MRRPLLPLLFFCAAVAWAWPLLPVLPKGAFVVPPTIAVQADPGRDIETQMLPRAGDSAHAVTLALDNQGSLMAAWFSGTREGARDVAIYASRHDGLAWSTPVRIVDRTRVARDTQRTIRKLGNPVLWRSASGRLHLWFVSVSYGGWAGSAINHMQSDDDGIHWSKVERIVTSPFWNLSTLVRTPPLALADGGVLLPVYHEFINKHPELLRLDAGMRLLERIRIAGASESLQPAVASLDATRALAMMRDASSRQRIRVSRSEDAGADWQPATASAIPNPNAAIALHRLSDGSLLLACNPTSADRNLLALMRSRDEGRSWSAPWFVEQGEPHDEFSYPALIQDAKGKVHLAYTWKRQSIKHLALPWARIEALR